MTQNNLGQKTKKLSVLVVDDEEVYPACLKFGLKGEYSLFDTAQDEQQASELIKKNKYEIVITDGSFPESKEDIWAFDPIKDRIYAGKKIAKLAKKSGAYVIGISSEPEKLQCKSLDVLIKKPFDIRKIKEIFKKRNERRYE